MSDDTGTAIFGRLTQLGFPFGSGKEARVRWASQMVTNGQIARIAQTEHMIRGVGVEEIAARTGIPVGRVYYHISRPPADFAEPDEGWE